jgi:hypothetical protein
VIVTIVAMGAVSILPASGSGLQMMLGLSGGSASSAAAEPQWNSGNLCKATGLGTTDVNCVSYISDSKAPLSYNFSAGKLKGGVVNVVIKGSNDCIYLNFHSFNTLLNVTLLGSGYSCLTPSGGGSSGNSISPMWGGGGGQGGSGCSKGSGWGGNSATSAWGSGGQWTKSCGPGVNIVVNSESDILNLTQSPSSYHHSRCNNQATPYATNVTIYGTSTVVNAVQSWDSSRLNTTVTYIGTKPGFSTCPSGITYGRVAWTEVSYGSHNTFNTIFVDGTNVAHVPPNSPYATEPLGPPNGISYGSGNLYGDETTTTAPTGSCQYLGV